MELTLHRTERREWGGGTATQKSHCHSHSSDLQDLRQQFWGLSEGQSTVPTAIAFAGLDRLVMLIFSANLHHTRYKMSLC